MVQLVYLILFMFFKVLPLLIFASAFAETRLCKRDDFGYDGKTRAKVLTARSQIEASVKKNGVVKYGKWFDQYTGETFQGNPYPALEIDHIIPIDYAIKNGGCQWSDERKKQFGTDFENLAITNMPDNRIKGANVCWRPKIQVCDYLLTQKDNLYKYNLKEPACLRKDLVKENC